MLLVIFLSTPSARRATSSLRAIVIIESISIHALREEGDWTRKEGLNRDENFYPRPPRGGRRQREFMRCPAYEFLSTPSARRATKVGGHGLQVRRISIHALREEGDSSTTFS